MLERMASQGTLGDDHLLPGQDVSGNGAVRDREIVEVPHRQVVKGQLGEQGENVLSLEESCAQATPWRSNPMRNGNLSRFSQS